MLGTLPQSTPAHRRTLRELVRAGCRNQPGVYRMRSANGTVVYVGQSRVLRSRLLSYFRARGRRNKAARILRHAFTIEWEYTPTEFGALLAELRLIKLHRPHFNSVMVTDEPPRGYVALVGGRVPGLRIVARSDHADAVAMYGPFRNVTALRDAVRALAELTGVRDCTLDERSRTRTLSFADAGAARVPGRVRRGASSTRVAGCLRHEFGTCAGPCIGRGESAAYGDAVALAQAFLDGMSSAPIDGARTSMQQAVERLEFERAAALRDRVVRLSWLYGRLQAFRASLDRLTFRYHALGVDGREYVYLVRRGTVRAEGLAPDGAAAMAAWEEGARNIFAGRAAPGAGLRAHDLDEFQLVARWFRKRPVEQARTRAP